MPNEFLVNSYRGQGQEHPDVARLEDGSFWVVWDSFYSEIGQDSYYYIAAQRYSAAGDRIGGEVLVDADVIGQSRHPSITALDDGGFAIAWETSQGSVLAETDIYTRAFNANGTARAGSKLAQPVDPDSQYAAEIAGTPGGGYLLTYTSYEGPQVERTDDVFLQRLDGDGDRIGGRVRFNQVTDFDQKMTQSDTLSNGNVVVVWDSENSGRRNPGGQVEDAVRGRILSPDGRAVTGEFLVDGDNDGVDGAVDNTETSIDVAALAGGRFVATWYETVLRGDEDTTFEIHGRVFTGSGAAASGEFVVRGGSDGVPRHSAVTALDNGNFVVAWDAPSPSFADSFARVYSADGRALGGAFNLNPPSRDFDEEYPELQALDGGGFVAVYESEGLDGDDDAIAGRIFGQGTARSDVEAMKWTGTFNAFEGNDRIIGTAGADQILGGDGADTLAGRGGADRLRGGLGADRLFGEAGADRFVYLAVTDSRNIADRRDTILDFSRTEGDKVDLSAIDANTRAAGNQSFDFVGTAAFSDAGDLRVVRSGSSVFAVADVNGDGAADFGLVFSGVGSVGGGDFIL